MNLKKHYYSFVFLFFYFDFWVMILCNYIRGHWAYSHHLQLDINIINYYSVQLIARSRFSLEIFKSGKWKIVLWNWFIQFSYYKKPVGINSILILAALQASGSWTMNTNEKAPIGDKFGIDIYSQIHQTY